MNIVIVSPDPLGIPPHIKLGEHDLWFRSPIHGLLSLSMDVVIFLPGCSDAQKAAAIPKTLPVNGKVIDL